MLWNGVHFTLRRRTPEAYRAEWAGWSSVSRTVSDRGRGDRGRTPWSTAGGGRSAVRVGRRCGHGRRHLDDQAAAVVRVQTGWTGVGPGGVGRITVGPGRVRVADRVARWSRRPEGPRRQGRGVVAGAAGGVATRLLTPPAGWGPESAGAATGERERGGGAVGIVAPGVKMGGDDVGGRAQRGRGQRGRPVRHHDRCRSRPCRRRT